MVDTRNYSVFVFIFVGKRLPNPPRSLPFAVYVRVCLCLYVSDLCI